MNVLAVNRAAVPSVPGLGWDLGPGGGNRLDQQGLGPLAGQQALWKFFSGARAPFLQGAFGFLFLCTYLASPLAWA